MEEARFGAILFHGKDMGSINGHLLRQADHSVLAKKYAPFTAIHAPFVLRSAPFPHSRSYSG